MRECFLSGGGVWWEVVIEEEESLSPPLGMLGVIRNITYYYHT